MSKKFTLGKTERLKSRKAIEQLFQQGKSFSTAPFRIFYEFKSHDKGKKDSLSNAKFGVGVSGKNFKKAVDRNRIKRLTREAYRLQKFSLLQQLAKRNIGINLFFIFTAKELPDYKTVSQKLGVILDKLIEKIDENISQNS